MNDAELRERMLDLLVSEALFGLAEDELVELARLKTRFPDWQDDESLQLTAAAIQLGASTPEESLPAHLENAIIKDFERNFGFRGVSSDTEARNSAIWNLLTARWLGWAVAGCLAGLLLFNGFVSRQQPLSVRTFSEERQSLISTSQDAVVITWSEADENHPLNLTGDIVWSNSQQRGFMRFRGLPVNNKEKECYQLWIFDANQSEKTPVDGGVFNVESNGEVIVPVDAKLMISKPTLFAVTVEKPGGVVVSSRDHLTAIAKVGI